MLVPTRCCGEKTQIDDDIEVTLIAVKRYPVRIGVEAPGSVFIMRAELIEEGE